ncbi:MAG: SPFH domain-containing protein [Gammaproteobacteria bacterium]
MQLHRSLISLIIAVIVLILISQSVGLVVQGQTGVRLNAGQVAATGLTPGLHLRVPFLGRIVGLDSGAIVLDSEQLNGGRVKLTSADGKTLEAAYLAVWRIKDTGAFCRANGCDESAGARRINDALMPLLQKAFGAHKSADLLAADDPALLADLPGKLTASLQSLGVTVRSVHLTQLDLPSDQLDAVYARMRDAQSAQAAQVHAQGVASADQIRAQADQQKAAILAKTEIQAQTIRGQAQAQAAAIYARAYNQDPEFFRFYRSLQAYRRAIKNNNSIIVLGPDSGFLKYFDGLKAPAVPQH